MAKYDCMLKLVMIGDNNVGKTCLLHRFIEGTFNTFNFTVGVDFSTKMVDLDGKKILLQIWDTAGHESFKRVISPFCKQAKGIMLVYDITNESTFDNLKHWISFIEEHAPSDADRIILGTKCDLNNHRQVSKESGEKLAIDYGIKFLETSAKSDINVKEAFFALTQDIMTRLNRNMSSGHQTQTPMNPSAGGEPTGGRNSLTNDNNAPSSGRCSLL